jgi:hypothetical protein
MGRARFWKWAATVSATLILAAYLFSYYRWIREGGVDPAGKRWFSVDYEPIANRTVARILRVSHTPLRAIDRSCAEERYPCYNTFLPTQGCTE